jgi:hypothetical protein
MGVDLSFLKPIAMKRKIINIFNQAAEERKIDEINDEFLESPE